MTASRSIFDSARRFNRLSGLIALAAVAPMFAVLAGAWLGIVHPALSWLDAYWWLMLLAGSLACAMVRAYSSFVLRCPACDFRLSQAGVRPLSPLLRGYVNHCPKCGASLQSDKTAG